MDHALSRSRATHDCVRGDRRPGTTVRGRETLCNIATYILKVILRFFLAVPLIRKL
jgi:hypothetical protein